MISTKLQSNFIEIARRHGCSPVNLLQTFRTPFPKNTSKGLLLQNINTSFYTVKLNRRSKYALDSVETVDKLNKINLAREIGLV